MTYYDAELSYNSTYSFTDTFSLDVVRTPDSGEKTQTLTKSKTSRYI